MFEVQNEQHNRSLNTMPAATTTTAMTLVLGVALSTSAAANYFETFYAMPEASHSDQASRNALRLARYKWPSALVPYAFADNAYTELEQRAVREAMSSLSNSTCVKFVPKSEEHVQHIKFHKVQPHSDT